MGGASGLTTPPPNFFDIGRRRVIRFEESTRHLAAHYDNGPGWPAFPPPPRRLARRKTRAYRVICLPRYAKQVLTMRRVR